MNKDVTFVLNEAPLLHFTVVICYTADFRSWKEKEEKDEAAQAFCQFKEKFGLFFSNLKLWRFKVLL